MSRVTTDNRQLDTAALIGRRIEAKRLERGWDKSQLARKSAVSASYIGRLERGDYPTPSLQRVQAIADALGVRMSELTDPPAELPSDILAEVRDICATDEELLRAVLADVRSYPPEQRAGALEFALQSLRALRSARSRPANSH